MLNTMERTDKSHLYKGVTVEPGQVAPESLIHRDTISVLFEHFGCERFTRKDFRPQLLPREALPHVCLLDVVQTGDDISYVYRVFGTDMRTAIGIDLTGKTVMDFPRQSCRSYLTRLFDECYRQGRPVFSIARIDYPRGVRLRTEKTFIPLFDAAHEQVAKILTLFTFQFTTNLATALELDMYEEPRKADELFKVYADLGQLAAASSGRDSLRVVAI